LEQFLRSEIGSCIPFATLESYADTDVELLDKVVNYLVSRPPCFTAAYFREEPPSGPRHSVEPLLVPYDEWKVRMERLIGSENTCFVSSWLLLPRDLPNTLPTNYRGRVIERGNSGEIPALVQWTRELVNDPIPSGKYGCFVDIWNFGTWGYVLPKTKAHKMAEWSQMTKASSEQVADFFQSLVLMFWVKFDLHGILIMSHQLDCQRVCSVLQGS